MAKYKKRLIERDVDLGNYEMIAPMAKALSCAESLAAQKQPLRDSHSIYLERRATTVT